MTKLAFDISEAAEQAPVGKTKLYEAINEGRLRAKKNGGRTMILAEDFQEFLRTLPDYEPVSHAA